MAKKHKFRYLLTPEEYEAFFAKALRIISFDTGEVIPFTLNPIQRRFLYNMDENCLILKARRHGISTLLLAIAFCNCLAFKNYQAAFIAHSKDDARKIFAKVHFFLKHLPKDLKVETSSESKDEVGFKDTGACITVSTAGSKAAKSGSDLMFLHCSEVAKFEAFDVLTSAREALLKGGVTFYESTAKGMNKFYDMWENSQGYFQQPRTSEIKPFFFSSAEHWSYLRDPEEGFKLNNEELAQIQQAKEHDVEVDDATWLKHMCWRRHKLGTMDDPEMMPQEHPLTPTEAFISTGNPVFNLHSLDKMKNTVRDYRIGNLGLGIKRELSFHFEKGGYLHYFIPPVLGRQYVIGVDTAEGKHGGDFSAACILDCQTREQVCEFHGLLDEDTYAFHLNQLGIFYNTALIAVEIPGPGRTVLGILDSAYHYVRLYLHEKDKDDLSTDIDGTLGWRSNNASKLEAIGLMKRDIRMGTIKLNSVNCIKEFRAYVTNDTGTAEAERGHHDDRVTAALVANHCVNHMPEMSIKYFPQEKRSNYYKYVQRTQPTVSRRIKKRGY